MALGCVLLLWAWAAGLPAAGQDADKVDAATKKLMAANGLLGRGLVRLAAEEYEAFLSQYPRHEQATAGRYGLAICRYRLGQYDPAITQLKAVLKDGTFKQRDEALAVLGHCHLSKGAHDQALSALDELLRKHPGSKHAEVAALNRAQILHMMGRHAESATACKAFLRKYPNTPRRTSAQYSLALAQFALGKHKEAAAALGQVLRNPNSPVALDATLLLGQCYEGLKKPKDAAAEYRKAVQIAPPDRRIEAQYSLGVVLYKANDFRAAAQTLSAALRANPTGRYAHSARFQLALAQLAAGKLPDARKILAEVIKIDPGRKVTARYWLAQCDMTEKKYTAARAILDELARLKKKPDNLEAVLYDRAICAMATGQYAQAAAELAGLRKAYPKGQRTADATYRQAFCLHKQEKYAESLPLCLLVAAETKLPIAPAASELAAENLFLLGRYPQAELAYQAMAKTAKDEGRKLRLTFRLSQCAYFRGDHAKAIELAEPLARNSRVIRDPNLRQAVFLLGDAQLQAGRFPDAVRNLTRYLPLAGKDREEVQFKLGLAQLRGRDKPSALRTFETLIRRGGRSQWTQRATFEAAQVYYKDGRPQRATPLLTKLMASQPGEDLAAPALYLQAWIDYDAKKHAGAARRFGELARRYAKHELAAEAAYQQGVCLVEAGESGEALGVLRGYVRAQPQGKHAAQAKHQVGRCLAKLGRHGEAVKVFAALAADAPGVTADLLYELAWSQRESKDAAAAATYRRLLKEFPKGRLATSARAELAEMLYAQEKYAEAAKLLEGVVSDKTAEASVLSLSRYRLGWCYDKLNEPAKAAAVFGPYARQHPNSEFAASAMYQAGVACAKLDKLDEAARQFAALVTRFGKHDLAPAAALKLGEVQSQAQEYDKSAEAYRAFLKAYPKSKFVFLAQFGIGWAMENRRKYDDARAWYGKVIAAHNGPTAARAQFQTGECYFAESKFEKAAAELLKVEIVYAYPQWSARALYEAGRAFEAMKRADQAKQQYKACAAKYKDTPSARQAAKRLKELAGGVEPTGP